MPERDILIVLDDILEAIDLIEHYNKNLSIADSKKIQKPDMQPYEIWKLSVKHVS